MKPDPMGGLLPASLQLIVPLFRRNNIVFSGDMRLDFGSAGGGSKSADEEKRGRREEIIARAISFNYSRSSTSDGSLHYLPSYLVVEECAFECLIRKQHAGR